MRRIPRLFVIVLALALPAAPSGSLAASAAPAAYYLATGDSLAYGVTAAGVPSDPDCLSPAAPGYVCVFYRYLRTVSPAIRLRNLAEPGADSCVWLSGKGPGSACADPLLGPLAPSQVTEAVAFLRAHRDQVSPITVDIGGDDLLPHALAAYANPAAALRELPGIVRSVGRNLGAGLARLRAAAPHADIVVAAQYNPLGGLSSPLLSATVAQAADEAITSLNAVISAEASRYGAQVADVASAFDASPGGAVSLTYVPVTALAGPSAVNIHPTPAGYRVYALAVIKASGFRAPLSLHAQLKTRLPANAGKDVVTGETAFDAVITVTIHLPSGHTRQLTARAGDRGTFRRRFRVGSSPGAGRVRVCARDLWGSEKCLRGLRFEVGPV
jgi:hypothetical protein